MILTWSVSHRYVALHANISRRSSRTQFQKLHLTIFGRGVDREIALHVSSICVFRSTQALVLSTYSSSHKYAGCQLTGISWLCSDHQNSTHRMWACGSMENGMPLTIRFRSRAHHYRARASRCGSHLQNYAHFICSGKHSYGVMSSLNVLTLYLICASPISSRVQLKCLYSCTETSAPRISYTSPSFKMQPKFEFVLCDYAPFLHICTWSWFNFQIVEL